MTDKGDQEICQMADDIRSKSAKDKEEIYENSQQAWFKSKLGKYYQESFSGAHDEAFKVFWVRDIDHCGYLNTDDIMFAHEHHWSMSRGHLSYDENKAWKFGKEGCYKEITEIDYLGYLNKFLELTGWKNKLIKESDH